MSYNSIDSMSSDYADSEVAVGMKAMEFFSKENTTRINIAQQKMKTWVSKMKEETKPKQAK